MEEIVKLLSEVDRKEKIGEVHEALNDAQTALDQAISNNAEELIPQAKIKLAGLLSRTGRYGDACQLAEGLLEDDGRGLFAPHALVLLGTCCAENNDMQAAEVYFQRAADAGRLRNDPRAIGHALINLAYSIYYPKGLFSLALRTLEEAAHFDPNSQAIHWSVPFLRGRIYQTMGDLYHTRLALDELLPMVTPATQVAGGYFYLWARLSLDEEEPQKAEEYLHLALRIANQSGMPDLNIWVRLEYSRFHRMQDQAAVARTWAEDALRYAERASSHFLIGKAYIERALTHWDLEDTMAALDDLNRAIELLSNIQAHYEVARAKFYLAAWAVALKSPDAASVWNTVAVSIVSGGFAFLFEKERAIAFPLVSAHLRSRNPQAREAANKMMAHLSKVPPPRLRVNGLGQFMVRQGRRVIPDQVWQRRKAGELFRHLLLEPNYSAGREEVLEDLWPDYSPSAAMDLFHQATSTLRHILEPDLPEKFPSRYLSVEGERVYLHLPPGSRIDFENFEQMLPAAIQARNIENLQQALAMYTDDLFPMDRYADWSVSRREELGELNRGGLLTLGQAFCEQDQYYDALSCARKIIQRDPWNEDAFLLGMQACQKLNDAPRALKLYQTLKETLDKELGIQPRQDVRELAEQLQQR